MIDQNEINSEELFIRYRQTNLEKATQETIAKGFGQAMYIRAVESKTVAVL